MSEKEYNGRTCNSGRKKLFELLKGEGRDVATQSISGINLKYVWSFVTSFFNKLNLD
ncbi:hypothetical protein SD074_01150 [Prolixibacter sp. SD074]|nr:hypothetical protein SD074_01150 [Prolixibacter sp. SD074]